MNSTLMRRCALPTILLRNEVPYVMLCGGEPLPVPHFFAVAERLGHAGVMLKIETNGQLFDAAVADRLAHLPIRSIQISLDGDTQDVYARQRPGASLAKTHAACRACRSRFAAGDHLRADPAEYPPGRGRDPARPIFGAFRFNTGKLMRIGRAARLWRKLEPSLDDYQRFCAVLDRQAQRVDNTMQFCHDPFTVEEGLKQSLATPPATMLVLPNGWVKIVAAVGYICGDVRRMTLTGAWESYRVAWQNETVITAIRRGIAQDLRHADANLWTSLTGAVETCAI